MLTAFNTGGWLAFPGILSLLALCFRWRDLGRKKMKSLLEVGSEAGGCSVVEVFPEQA